MKLFLVKTKSGEKIMTLSKIIRKKKSLKKIEIIKVVGEIKK